MAHIGSSLLLSLPLLLAVGGAAPARAADPAGAPISAPLETWTWIPVPEAKCLNGSSTGIGVNLTGRSDRLFIFFEGGGACWDYSSCWEDGKSANVNGYGQAEFEGGQPYSRLPLFNRDNPDNPLADASYVYVPYCTGDLHSGDHETTLGRGATRKASSFVGYRNVTAYLDRLLPTFPDTSRVWISGWSAGGYGATLNWAHIQEAFGPGVSVDVIADSSPMINPATERWNTWRTLWNIQFPEGCTDCSSGLPAVMDHLADRYDGENRFSLLSYDSDAIVSSYWLISRLKFTRELNTLTSSLFDPSASLRYFLANGSAHVLLGSNLTSDGVELYDWLDQQVNDDPAWASVRP